MAQMTAAAAAPHFGAAHEQAVVGNGFGGDPNGAVWKLSPHNKLTPLYKFKDGDDGEYPNQAPIVDGAGNVYGTILTMKGTNYAGAISTARAIRITGLLPTAREPLLTARGYPRSRQRPLRHR